MNTTMKTSATLLVAALAALASWAVPNLTDHDGPARWESTTVTISPDLREASEQWGDTITFEVVPADEAQIRTVAGDLKDHEGGEAVSEFENGNYLSSCTIATDGTDTTGVLTHELGHCLGLTHRSGVESSNMHWWAGDELGGWSDTVTDHDRATLADLYKEN